MEIKLLAGGYYASNCYYVRNGNEALLIDPSVPFDDAMAQLGDGAVIPKTVLLTHAHFDHMFYLDEWRTRAGAALALHVLEEPALHNPQINLFGTFLHKELVFDSAEILLQEGDKLSLDGEALTVMHTPGHTVGSICLYGDGVIFTGDTIFTDGGYGRTDFYGGSEQALFDSIRRLKCLNVNATMYPGHGMHGNFKNEIDYFSFI